MGPKCYTLNKHEKWKDNLQNGSTIRQNQKQEEYVQKNYIKQKFNEKQVSDIKSVFRIVGSRR